MGQVLHDSARTTAAVRRAIQHSQESMRALSRRYGINPKTVAKWKKRESTADRRTGPAIPRSTVLSVEQEAIIVAFRKHTLLPLDDRLYALQATIPQLTGSSLYRCLERHGISRLPEIEGDKPRRKKFDTYPIGFFHIDLAEVRTAEGKVYLFVAIDRTSKFAVIELVEKPTRERQPPSLKRSSMRLRPASIRFSPTTASSSPIYRRIDRIDKDQRAFLWSSIRQAPFPPRDRSPADLAQPALDQWAGRTDELNHQRCHRQTILLRQP
jgi:hypothetical protein